MRGRLARTTDLVQLGRRLHETQILLPAGARVKILSQLDEDRVMVLVLSTKERGWLYTHELRELSPLEQLAEQAE